MSEVKSVIINNFIGTSISIPDMLLHCLILLYLLKNVGVVYMVLYWIGDRVMP